MKEHINSVENFNTFNTNSKTRNSTKISIEGTSELDSLDDHNDSANAAKTERQKKNEILNHHIIGPKHAFEEINEKR